MPMNVSNYLPPTLSVPEQQSNITENAKKTKKSAKEKSTKTSKRTKAAETVCIIINLNYFV